MNECLCISDLRIFTTFSSVHVSVERGFAHTPLWRCYSKLHLLQKIGLSQVFFSFQNHKSPSCLLDHLLTVKSDFSLFRPCLWAWAMAVLPRKGSHVRESQRENSLLAGIILSWVWEEPHAFSNTPINFPSFYGIHPMHPPLG